MNIKAKQLTEKKKLTAQVVFALEQDKRRNTVLCFISLVIVGIAHYLGVCQQGAWVCFGIACCGNLYLSICCWKFKKENVFHEES